MEDVMNGGWIDTLGALVSSIRQVGEALIAILYLIGKLFGG
jgi:hypothetical protein